MSDERYFKIYRCTFDMLTNAERFVFGYIEQFSRAGKECTASQEYIAQRLGLSVKTVKRCVKALSCKGFIHVQRSGQRKERNAYTVNRDRLNDALRAWKRSNRDQSHALPDVLRVYDSMLSAFKASTQCLLVANLYQIQHAGQEKGGLFEDGTQYSQEELARQCGCGLTAVKDAISELESSGIITIFDSELNWKKSKKCYVLGSWNIAGNVPRDIAGNVPREQSEMSPVKDSFQQKTGEKAADKGEKSFTVGNVPCEQSEMSPVKSFSQSEMSPNEYISSFMNTEMNTDGRAAAPLVRCSVSCDIESDTMRKMRNADKMRAFAEMSESELEQILSDMNAKE